MEIRQATEKDIAFLTEAIIEAEKSNTNKLSYSTIFGLTDDEVEAKVQLMLEEDIPGQELCISGFLIAEEAGDYAAACCSWIEGEQGQYSSIIKANILLWFFGSEICERASNEHPYLKELNFERKTDSLQIESVYTKPAYRGRGISGKLIKEHIQRSKERQPQLNLAQVILAETNTGAASAYQKLGFREVDRRKTQDPRVFDILPSDTKILMELKIKD